MKYNLISYNIGRESEKVDDKFNVDIEVMLQAEDDFIPPFPKTINVESNNSQTGFEVDKQRADAVMKYINEISK